MRSYHIHRWEHHNRSWSL